MPKPSYVGTGHFYGDEWNMAPKPWGLSRTSQRYPSKGRVAAINLQRQLHGLAPITPPNPPYGFNATFGARRHWTATAQRKALRGYRSPSGGFIRAPQGRGYSTDWTNARATESYGADQARIKAQSAGTDAAFNASGKQDSKGFWSF